MKLRTLHRSSALLIGVFAIAHITNHLVSLMGIPSHIAFMEVARHVYRQPMLEGLLLLCVVFQLASGPWFVLRGWRQRRGTVAWLQAISGTYLAFFLAVHVGAVLYGRAVLNLDTNFYFAAAGMHVPPNGLFFAPYYFLAVLALFTHLAGTGISLLIVLSLAGKLQPVDVPAQYKATYAGHTLTTPICANDRLGVPLRC